MELHNPFIYLNYDFGIKAVFSAVLSGLICSAIGTYIILRKMSFIGAGLSHVAFAGIAFGFFIGSSPTLWALVFTLTSGIVIWYLSIKKKIHYDTTLGILFAASMGLAVMFLSLSNNYGSEALSYLFGSPLIVSNFDILLLILIAFLTFLFYMFFWREIYLITFSEDIAKASSYNVELVTFLAFLVMSFAVTLSIKAVGALLVFSLLVMPAASAFKLTKNYNSFFFLSVFFGFASSFLGVFLSFIFDIPSGAAITLSSFFIFLTSLLRD
ncbi:metal ABC transporter permease [Desulfurobacterium thermolithotrophum]|uniref:metal ABC transporter permease n=1 Tax=Desulfurobacterium thermolithotrophum TaxID=64160 RepID=UPI0013D05BFF|nr:metal ABC transporter permease [Desulfurobacterium thermolithotrophum]